jgi:hypothetical protein
MVNMVNQHGSFIILLQLKSLRFIVAAIILHVAAGINIFGKPDINQFPAAKMPCYAEPNG